MSTEELRIHRDRFSAGMCSVEEVIDYRSFVRDSILGAIIEGDKLRVWFRNESDQIEIFYIDKEDFQHIQ